MNNRLSTSPEVVVRVVPNAKQKQFALTTRIVLPTKAKRQEAVVSWERHEVAILATSISVHTPYQSGLDLGSIRQQISHRANDHTSREAQRKF